MKKHIITFFLALFLITSVNSFAQVDSSKMASTQRQIDKDQKKADKLEKKAKKQERKQKRHEEKMQRKEKKRDRKLKSIEKGERKLEDIKKDTTGTSTVRELYQFKSIQSKNGRSYDFNLSLSTRDFSYTILR
ncbi:MAG: hypothetical protein ABR503_11790, partial [Chitinophagaceae bacterium]